MEGQGEYHFAGENHCGNPEKSSHYDRILR